MNADSEKSGMSNLRKGIFILPSLVTTGSLFVAFYAIVQATQGRFEIAAACIFACMVLDGLDGRIARWTNTSSYFGKEYDSLVDVIAFGLTPALVIFEWILSSYGKPGWLTSFLFVACTALRLARFNSVEVKDKSYFQGLPCPAAAAFLAGWIWVVEGYGLSSPLTATVSIVFTVASALAMVSNIPFMSFKDFDPKNRIPFFALILIVVPFVLISFDPPLVLFVLFAVYFLSGPIVWVRRRQLKKSNVSTKATTDIDDNDKNSRSN
jgi:CDP-diacylglycerol---serine O-phosphatidyltransferase